LDKEGGAMARPLRLEFPGAIYHLTGRGNARQRIFFTDADRKLLLMSAVQIVQAVQSPGSSPGSVQNVY